MKAWKDIAAPIFLAITGLALLSCQDRIASSEVGNPNEKAVVSGLALDSSGRPVAWTLVRLRPKEYLGSVVLDRVDANPEWTTFSDTSGRFSLNGVGPGDFRVELSSGMGLGAITECRVDANSRSLDLSSVRMTPLGRIEGRILGISGGAFVRVFGLEKVSPIDSGSGRFRLDWMPQGNYKLDVMSIRNESFPRVIEGVRVATGSPTSLPDMMLLGNFSNWKHVAMLSRDSTQGMADTLTVPVLVRLQSGSFDFSQAKADGSDLRFVSDAGTTLSHAIEVWDPAQGEAVIWVNWQDRFAQSGRIKIFWGNSGVAATFPIPPVFVASAGYTGVWHLEPAPSGLPPRFIDESQEAILVPVQGAPPLPISTPWGKGLELDGTQALATEKPMESNRYLTLSLWFRTATTTGGKLIGFGSSPYGPSVHYDRHIWMDDEGHIHFGTYPKAPGDSIKVLSTTNGYNDGSWHLATAVVSNQGQQLFMDGKPVAMDTVPMTPLPYAGYWRIGYDNLDGVWLPKPSSYHFKGEIDEVRVLHIPWDSARVSLEYENQKPGSQWLQWSAK